MTKKFKFSQSACKIVVYALQILQENGSSMAKSDLWQILADQIGNGELQLPDRFRELDKKGRVQWETALAFYAIYFVRANFMRREKGVWRLLPESEEWLAKGEQPMIDEATRRYQESMKNRQPRPESAVESDDGAESESHGETSLRPLEYYEGEARAELISYIRAMDEFDFQELVAALLRAMGYVTPFVSERGQADGGVDIIAYRDHLGASTPRLKVQVKHQQATISEPDINNLNGVLTGDDIGVCVSLSGFSAPAKKFARATHKHLELIDINRFIDLWREFYPKMVDEDKKRMPLYQILFLAREE